MKQQQRGVSSRPTGMRAAWATVTQSWFTPMAVLVGIADIAFAIWVVLDPEGKMPGQAIGPVFLLGFAAAMFTGLWLRWRARFGGEAPLASPGPRANRGSALFVFLGILLVAIIAMAIVGSVVPLLVGVLLLAGVVIVVARRRTSPRAEPVPTPAASGRQSVALADILIVAGTLPALALFWFVVPAILALVVIGGVIGTQPGARSRVPA